MGKKVVFTWGRFNPPTIGHGVVMDRVAAEAKSRKADYRIFASKTETPIKRNPLTFKDKIKFIKQSFPKHARYVDKNPRLNTILTVMKELGKKYTEVAIVVGSDRQQEINKLLHVYNGREYDFEKIDVVSAGERDPDADDVSGMSASKMRKAAADGDYRAFKAGSPIRNPKALYDTLRSSMKITEEFYSLMEEVHDLTTDNSVKGKRFNQMLRFGLAPREYYSITIRAFKDMEKSGPNPELRKHIFNVADKTLEYVMNDNLLYHRFLVLLNQDFLNIYQEEQRDALLKKAQKSGIDFPTLLEVYMRGLAASPIHGKTPSQYAFDRVNSFVAGGYSQKKIDADIWERYNQQENRSKKMKKFVTLDPFHKGPKTKKPAPEWGTKDMADRYCKVTPGQPDNIGEVAPPGKDAESFIMKNKEKFNKQYGDEKGKEILYRTAWKLHGKKESVEEGTNVNKQDVPVYAPVKGKKGHHKVVGHVRKSATSTGAAKVGKSRTAKKVMKLKSPEYPEGPGWVIKEDAMAPEKRFKEITQEIEENVELKSVGTYFDAKKLVAYPMQTNNKPDMNSATDIEDISTEWVKSLSKNDLSVVRKAVKRDRGAARRIEDALKEETEIDEGTWALPDSPAKMRKLKALLKKPLPVGANDHVDGNAESQVSNLIGDDEILDAIEMLRRKKGPKADARLVIKKWMKKNLAAFGIKEALEEAPTLTILPKASARGGNVKEVGKTKRGSKTEYYWKDKSGLKNVFDSLEKLRYSLRNSANFKDAESITKQLGEALDLGKIDYPSNKDVIAIQRKLRADAPEILKQYQKLVKRLKTSAATSLSSKEIVYIRTQPNKEYQKRTGMGDEHQIHMRPIQGNRNSSLGKEVVYHKGSNETIYNTVLAIKESVEEVYLRPKKSPTPEVGFPSTWANANTSKAKFSTKAKKKAKKPFGIFRREETEIEEAAKAKEIKAILKKFPADAKRVRGGDSLSDKKNARLYNALDDYFHKKEPQGLRASGDVYNYIEDAIDDVYAGDFKESFQSEVAKKGRRSKTKAWAKPGEITDKLPYAVPTWAPRPGPRPPSPESKAKMDQRRSKAKMDQRRRARGIALRGLRRQHDEYTPDNGENIDEIESLRRKLTGPVQKVWPLKSKSRKTTRKKIIGNKKRLTGEKVDLDKAGERYRADTSKTAPAGQPYSKTDAAYKRAKKGVYTYNTTKTSGGFKWSILNVVHGKKASVVDSGTEKTRVRALAAAKKAKKKFSN